MILELAGWFVNGYSGRQHELELSVYVYIVWFNKTPRYIPYNIRKKPYNPQKKRDVYDN